MTSSRLENPFTRVLSADEQERLAAIPPVIKDPREVLHGELVPKGAAPITAAERAEVVKTIDNEIKERADRTVKAVLRYRDPDKSDMTAEERGIALDASLSDKDAPIGLKAALRIRESYMKQDTEAARPALALTINMFGDVAHNYEHIKVDK